MNGENIEPKDNKQNQAVVSDGRNFSSLTIDVYRVGQEIFVVAPLPGVDATALDVVIDNDHKLLTIKSKAESPLANRQNDGLSKYITRECRWGEFSHQISLPGRVDEDKIKTKFKKNILLLRLLLLDQPAMVTPDIIAAQPAVVTPPVTPMAAVAVSEPVETKPSAALASHNNEQIKDKINYMIKSMDKGMGSLFSRRSVGIDIADRSIEVVEIIKKGDDYKINSGRVVIEEGVVKRGVIMNAEKLAIAVRSVFAGAKPNPIVLDKAIFGLPESQVFSHIFSAAFETNDELINFINKETEAAIPVPFKELHFIHKILSNKSAAATDKKEKEVLVIGVSKQVISDWREFFKTLGLTIEFLDLEMFANYRGIGVDGKNSGGPVCMVDIGSVITNLSVMDKNNLYYSYSFNSGGEIFTQKIIDEFTFLKKPINYEQAEALKIEKGVADLKDVSDIPKILSIALFPIAEEIKTAVKVGGERSGQPINNVILTGGSATMKGLAAHIENLLKSGQGAAGNIKVLVGEPRRLGNQEINFKFIEAAGLALKAVDRGLFEKMDINLIPENTSKNKVFESLSKVKDVRKIFSKKSALTEPGQKKHQEVVSHDTEDMNEEEPSKTGRQVKILILILVLGLGGIGGAVYYRNKKPVAKVKAPISADTAFSQKQTQTVEVSIATTAAKGGVGIATGKLIEETIPKATDYQKAVADSQQAATKKISAGYMLWPEPIKVSSSSTKPVYPLKVTWLAYAEKQITSLALDEVKKQINNEKFLFSDMEKKSVVLKDGGGLIIMQVVVNIMVNAPVNK